MPPTIEPEQTTPDAAWTEFVETQHARGARVTFRLFGNACAELIAALRKRDDAIRMLKDRIEQLEAREPGGVVWAGVHEVERQYAEGQLVTKRGLWLALKPTRTTPGTDPSAWRLIVRDTSPRGREGR